MRCFVVVLVAVVRERDVDDVRVVMRVDLWPKAPEDFFFPKVAKMLSPSVLTELKPWLKLTRIKEDKMANMTNPLVAMRPWWRNEFTKPRVDFLFVSVMLSFAAW